MVINYTDGSSSLDYKNYGEIEVPDFSKSVRSIKLNMYSIGGSIKTESEEVITLGDMKSFEDFEGFEFNILDDIYYSEKIFKTEQDGDIVEFMIVCESQGSEGITEERSYIIAFKGRKILEFSYSDELEGV